MPESEHRSMTSRLSGLRELRRPQVAVPSARRGGMSQGRLLLVTLVLGCLAAIALSMVTNNAMLFVWYEVVVYALFAMSTNVVVGWNGVGTFGQALYFASGAYTVGLLDHHGVSLPPEVLLLAGGLIADIVGVFYVLIAFRL